MQCQLCCRELAAAEPIYRVAVRYGINMYRKFGGAVCSLCGGCALSDTEDHARLSGPAMARSRALRPLLAPVILNGRRRPTAAPRLRRPVPQRHLFKTRRRAAPAVSDRHPSIVCAKLRRRFTARSNAVHCSRSCQQEAYYRRLRPATELSARIAAPVLRRAATPFYCSRSCRQKAYYRTIDSA